MYDFLCMIYGSMIHSDTIMLEQTAMLGRSKKLISQIRAASTPSCGSYTTATGTRCAYWTGYLIFGIALAQIAQLSNKQAAMSIWVHPIFDVR